MEKKREYFGPCFVVGWSDFKHCYWILPLLLFLWCWQLRWSCVRILYSIECVWCVCSAGPNSLLPHRLQSIRKFLCPWNFPGKNTGVVCHFLLQGIFLTQGSNPCFLHLLHWQADSFQLSPLGSPIYTEYSVWTFKVIHKLGRGTMWYDCLSCLGISALWPLPTGHCALRLLG